MHSVTNTTGSVSLSGYLMNCFNNIINSFTLDLQLTGLARVSVYADHRTALVSFPSSSPCNVIITFLILIEKCAPYIRGIQ